MHVVGYFLLVASASAQDNPTVTIDRTATVQAHLAEVQRATGGKLRFVQGDPGKEVPVKIQGASFFEALDAICKASGNVTYFGAGFADAEGTISVRADPWVEYPSVYSGPFRVMVCEMTCTAQSSSLGNRSWSRVHMVLFAPPWVAVGRESGAKTEFVALEARDAIGNDLIPTPEERDPVQRISVGDYASIGTKSPSNSAGKTVQLRPFDLDRGLSVFKGHVVLTVAEGVDAAIAPREGESVQTAAGTLAVDRVSEHRKTDAGMIWRIQLTLRPESGKGSLRTLLENRVKEGENVWRELDLPRDGATFEAVVGPLPKLPPSLVFRARKGVRTTNVPFEFRNLTFKKA